MKHVIVLIFFIFSHLNTLWEEKPIPLQKDIKKTSTSPKTPFPIQKKYTYKEAKEYIRKRRDTTNSLKTLSVLFYDGFINDLLPHWYGTPWDFNGYTNIPNQGVIACGYFVSTTLKHMGINLNRYKFAQQYSLLEVATLDPNYISLKNCTQDSVQSFSKKNLADGLYIVGLDNHVGFLVKKEDENYFIHSDPSLGVIQEHIRNSVMFNYSRNFYIGQISTNLALLQQWKDGTYISIKTL